MSSPLSSDLRERVVHAVEDGASRRGATKRFGVSPSSAIRWQVEAHADLIPGLYEARPTIFLSALRGLLSERGVMTSESGLSRVFNRHGITRKKNTAHAAEQDRSDVKAEREDLFEAQDQLDPDTLVFLDETAATTAMTRRYGRAPRGERCRVGVPQGHWLTTTITAALRSSGVVATTMFDGATNGARFRAYVTDILVPALRPGDTVILDNLPAQKVAGVRAAIQAAGARLL